MVLSRNVRLDWIGIKPNALFKQSVNGRSHLIMARAYEVRIASSWMRLTVAVYVQNGVSDGI